MILSRRWGRETESDADGTHVAMGTAMAGMLVPALNLLPATLWEAVFAGAAGWFAWQATRARGGHPPGRWRCRHPVPHLVENAAMLYMLLAVAGSRARRPGNRNADARDGRVRWRRGKFPRPRRRPGAVHGRLRRVGRRPAHRTDAGQDSREGPERRAPY